MYVDFDYEINTGKFPEILDEEDINDEDLKDGALDNFNDCH